MPRDRDLILNGSPCHQNLHPGGVMTVDEAQSAGRSLCPHIGICEKPGTIHPQGRLQCCMLLGWEIAKNVLKERTSLEREMPDFQAFFGGVKPSDGFVNSDNRVDFALISDKDEALLKIRAFADQLLEGVDVTRPASVGTRHRDFNDVIASSMGSDGAIDALKMQALEGSCGSNGGRGCDVTEGPCSCGAWH